MFSIITNILARAISYLLHPLSIPTIVFTLLAIYQPELVMPFTSDTITYLLFFIAIFSFIIPVFMIMILYYFKKIDTLLLDNQEDRQISMLATSAIYIIGIYILNTIFRLDDGGIIVFSFITISMIIAMIITKFWKISLHCVGIAGLVIICGFLAFSSYQYDSWLVFLGAIVLSGFLASARLHLNKHSLAQVGAGFLVGLISGIFFLSYLQSNSGK